MTMRPSTAPRLSQPRQRVQRIWPDAYCYLLNPRTRMFAVILGDPPYVYVTNLSAKVAWEQAARRLNA